MKSNYNKFKDMAPQDTISEIRERLDQAGLSTVVQWTGKAFNGAHSNRITLYPSKLGTNGKGTDELYCAASGYAELMERMQNNRLAVRALRPRVLSHGTFLVFPDEKMMSISEYLCADDAVLHEIFEKLGFDHASQRFMFLKEISDTCPGYSGSILTVPFADLTDNKITWLAPDVLYLIFGSNGMAAGNTLEEAMVQGMCEICERYVLQKLLKGSLVPPQIPAQELKNYSITGLINEIESDGRFKVTILDCSLGKGFPVAAAMITDLTQGTFILRCGAHPSLAIAVERALTESFQGASADNMHCVSRFGSQEESSNYHNVRNIIKIGQGIYPSSMLAGNPSWEYRPWREWEGQNNRELLRKLLRFVQKRNWHILIRDNSHMGFPAVQIVIPGISEITPASGLWLRNLHTKNKVAASLCHFPDLSPEEEKRLLSFIQFNEYSVVENLFSYMAMRPLDDEALSTARLGALLALKAEDYPLAAHFFENLEGISKDPLYERAMKQYVSFRADGLTWDEAMRLIQRLYLPETAAKIREDTEDPHGLLKKTYPPMQCYNCEHCEWNGSLCDNRSEEDVLIRIKDAMSNSSVDQNALLNLLKDLITDSKHSLY